MHFFGLKGGCGYYKGGQSTGQEQEEASRGDKLKTEAGDQEFVRAPSHSCVSQQEGLTKGSR